ncbi:MAG: IS4 family transposase [Balneolales bacterium]
MYSGKIIFAQIMDIVPKYEFQKIVKRHNGNHRVRKLSCREQFCCMCFGQLTFRDSLRDVTTTLNTLEGKRYHMGLTGKVPLSTLSDANAKRPWKMYQDLAMVLIAHARKLYDNEQPEFEKAKQVFALDSTTIDLCLSLFPWAQFRHSKAAIKMHTLMDLQGSIPTFIHITDGRVHDVNILDDIPIQPGAIYIMDRGYIDFARLFKIHRQGGQFVIRARKNLKFYRKKSTLVDTAGGLQCDQIIRLSSVNSKNDYPEPLRRVRVIDKENNQDIVILTNITTSTAEQIAAYYKQRWQIELFFKWIKQNLRIKAFYGQSVNAVKTQIWTAVCTYMILIIIQKTFDLSVSLHTMMQVLSVSLLENMTFKELFSSPELMESKDSNANQLGLFDF